MARVLVCVASENRRLRLEANFRQEVDLEIVGATGHEGEALTLRRNSDPDLVIIDEALLADVGDEFAAYKPVPTLVLCETTSALQAKKNDRKRLVRRTRLALLDRDDEFSRSHVNAQAHLALARGGGGAITTTGRVLESSVTKIYQSARREGITLGLAAVATMPLDVIALVGDASAAPVIRQALEGIDRVPIPLLIAAETPAAALVPASGELVIADVGSVVHLEVFDGAGVVPPGCLPSVSGTVLHIDAHSKPGPADLGAILQLVGPTGLTVCISHADESLVHGLAATANDGGLVVVVEPSSVPQGAAGAAALRWGVVEKAVRAEQLGWLLRNAFPYHRKG